ncbi:MAG TPA: hypothetical protein VEU08_20365 [Vicinamibacterales bacterium]|nr:hypothetical protein [Vicinamibacterales bacterium]
MRKNIRRKREAQRRAHAVCISVRGVIEATDSGKTTLAKLGTAVDQVEGLYAEQQQALNTRRVAQRDCDAARSRIRDLLKAVVDVSKVVQLEDGSATVMNVPAHGPDDLLLADANAIHDAAAAHAAAFTAAGLPENVLTDLQAQIGAFKAAKAVIANVRRAFTATTQAARTALKTGDEATPVLEAILAHGPNADPKALTRFRFAKLIGPSRAGDTPAAQTEQPATGQPAAVEPAAHADPVQTTPTQAA